MQSINTIPITKFESVNELIDHALQNGYAYQLSNQDIEYLIKYYMQRKFGAGANNRLRPYNLQIVEEDKVGIEKMEQLTEEWFKEFFILTEAELI